MSISTFCRFVFFRYLCCFFFFFFFFSSRRRHTRWNCDWSSDVCSSDLVRAGLDVVAEDGGWIQERREGVEQLRAVGPATEAGDVAQRRERHVREEIGRASCRERV